MLLKRNIRKKLPNILFFYSNSNSTYTKWVQIFCPRQCQIWSSCKCYLIYLCGSFYYYSLCWYIFILSYLVHFFSASSSFWPCHTLDLVTDGSLSFKDESQVSFCVHLSYFTLPRPSSTRVRTRASCYKSPIEPQSIKAVEG